MNDTDRDTINSIESAFCDATWRLIAWWFAAALPTVAMSFFVSPAIQSVIITLTLASGLLAVIALQSGILIPRLWIAVSLMQYSSPMRRFLAGAVSVMVVRILGTVALFLTCRYHLSASAETIVSMTLLWYVYLTVVEVIALGREMSRFGPTELTSRVMDRSNFIA